MTIERGDSTNQVVTEKLHDEGRVLVALLRKGVKLCNTQSAEWRYSFALIRTGNSIVKSLLGQLASLIGGVRDLVVEHGEVQGKTKADRVGRGQAAGGDLSGSLVSLERLVGRGLALITNGELGEVAVVVTLPAIKVKT